MCDVRRGESHREGRFIHERGCYDVSSSPQSRFFVMFSSKSSGYQLGCAVAAESAQWLVEHVKKCLQNIPTEGMPHTVGMSMKEWNATWHIRHSIRPLWRVMRPSYHLGHIELIGPQRCHTGITLAVNRMGYNPALPFFSHSHFLATPSLILSRTVPIDAKKLLPVLETQMGSRKWVAPTSPGMFL